VNIRQWTDDRRGLLGLLGIVLAVVGVAVFAMRSGSIDDGILDRVWFTSDDGKTWFPVAAMTESPMEKDGKSAVRCYVFACDGEQFVSHVERLNPETLKRIKQGVFDPMLSSEVEVKDPGTGPTGWIKINDPKAAGITAPRCPKHPDKLGTPVYP